MQLGISSTLDSVTAQYVDVRLDRKRAVLDTYHNTPHPYEKNKVKKKKNLANSVFTRVLAEREGFEPSVRY